MTKCLQVRSPGLSRQQVIFVSVLVLVFVFFCSGSLYSRLIARGSESDTKSRETDKYSCKSVHDLSPAQSGRPPTMGRNGCDGLPGRMSPIRCLPRPSTGVHRTLIALLLPITDGTEAAVASSALRELYSDVKLR